MASLAFATTTLSSANNLQSKWSSHVIQNTSQQDGTFHGTTADFEYGGVFDGHGGGYKKHLMRNLLANHSWGTTLQTANFHKTDLDEQGNYVSPLFDAIQRLAFSGFDKTISQLQSQGSTLSIYKAYSERFEFFISGDSTIKLYANTLDSPSEFKCVFTSKDHDPNHEEDMARLESRTGGGTTWNRRNWKRGINNIINGVRKTWGLKVINATDITMIPSAYIHYDDGSVINMTSSIGHIPSLDVVTEAKVCGPTLSVAQRSLTASTISREPGIKYCILIGTDGLWDMACDDDDAFFTDQIQNHQETAAKTIAELAHKRWGQEWNYICPVEKDQKKITMSDNQRDDIGVMCAYI